MTLPEFDVQFNRLAGHFHMPTDASRETLAVDWFKAVEHYHVDALDRAVTELIRTAEDRFWPALGKVLKLIQSRFDKYERTSGKCQTCHGSSWIDSAPYKSNGMIYEGVCVRCPDCGIPAPDYKQPNGRTALTSREFAEWRLNDHPKQYMPAGLEAKPFKAGELEDMRAAMNRLHIKLFGVPAGREEEIA